MLIFYANINNIKSNKVLFILLKLPIINNNFFIAIKSKNEVKIQNTNKIFFIQKKLSKKKFVFFFFFSEHCKKLK